jgi:hypothetical protein
MRSHSYKHRSHRFTSCRPFSVCSDLGELGTRPREVASRVRCYILMACSLPIFGGECAILCHVVCHFAF